MKAEVHRDLKDARPAIKRVQRQGVEAGLHLAVSTRIKWHRVQNKCRIKKSEKLAQKLRKVKESWDIKVLSCALFLFLGENFPQGIPSNFS